jgi:nitroimidazol reductase NimA-like FMN-containing flavoprotein (pyridoxamine 5'-phosphate oxidase superfamily)
VNRERAAENDDMITDASDDILATDECWRLLRSSEVGRLAIANMDQPDIFPVNYVVDHGAVVFRTADGTKLAAALGQSVAFEVDGYDAVRGEAWSVVIKGHALQIKFKQEVFDTYHLPLFPWHASPKPHFVRIEPESVTGRRFHVVDPTAWDVPSKGARRSATE